MVKRQRTAIIETHDAVRALEQEVGSIKVDDNMTMAILLGAYLGAQAIARNLEDSFPELFPLRASAPLRENSFSAQPAEQIQTPEGDRTNASSN